MPENILSVCERLQDQLCKKQNFELAAAVRDVKRAYEGKNKGNRTVAVKKLLMLMLRN